MTADPLSPQDISEIRAFAAMLAPSLGPVFGADVVALCDEVDRLRAALASTETPEPWVTSGPTGRSYRVNVDLLNDGDPMPKWLTPLSDTPHEEGGQP